MANSQSFDIQVEDIDVRVTLKRMKSIRLHVKPTGDVTLSAPFGTRKETLRAFVCKKMPWIKEQKSKYAYSPAALAEGATKAEIDQWRSVVKACVPPLVAEWEQILGVKVTTLAYRNMKSRWGSCQPATGRVCINVRLALYPPECLEYVVVHELCHLLEPNHDAGFKKLLGKVMPDWKQRERMLNPR